MAKSMGETPVFGTKQRWDDYVTRWEWDEKGNFQLARFFGDVTMEYIHSMETKSGKRYPEFCHGWDVDKGEFYKDREDRCPCCALNVKGQHRYFLNVIDIEAEENKPVSPKANWSPIRFLDASPTLFTRLKELTPVNKGAYVTDAERGAIVQIKFNKSADAANMYSASMDTKAVALTEDQKAYIVTQKYPDGSAKIVRGTNGLPACFEYVRCVNSRDDMIKGLRRNGYYGETEESAAAAHSFDAPNRELSREEKVAQIDAEASVETIDFSKVFAGEPNMPLVDEEPTPKATTSPVAEVFSKPKAKKEPYEECPTEFGNFASHMDCFTKCGVVNECRAASNEAVVAAPAPTKKKEVAPVVDDDDDTV